MEKCRRSEKARVLHDGGEKAGKSYETPTSSKLNAEEGKGG